MTYKQNQYKYNLNLLSPVEVFQLILAGKIKKFPDGYWRQSNSVQNAIEIIRFFIEQYLQWDDYEIKKRLTYKVFAQHHLSAMLNACFQCKLYNAISQSYPGRFNEWNFRVAEWTEEKIRAAMRWFIEEKLQWDDEQLKQNLSQALFKEYGVGCIIGNSIVNGSPVRAIQIAYPGKFKDWEFKTMSKFYWTRDNIARATRWLIEEKLGWSDEEVKQHLTARIIIKHGLGGMMVSDLIKNSPYRAINIAYPSKFSPEDFQKVPMNYWNKENIARRLQWLIEEELQWTDEEVRQKLTTHILKKYNLRRILDSPTVDKKLFSAVNLAYPGRFKESDFSCHRKRRFKDVGDRKTKG